MLSIICQYEWSDNRWCYQRQFSNHPDCFVQFCWDHCDHWQYICHCNSAWGTHAVISHQTLLILANTSWPVYRNLSSYSDDCFFYSRSIGLWWSRMRSWCFCTDILQRLSTLVTFCRNGRPIFSNFLPATLPNIGDSKESSLYSRPDLDYGFILRLTLWPYITKASNVQPSIGALRLFTFGRPSCYGHFYLNLYYHFCTLSIPYHCYSLLEALLYNQETYQIHIQVCIAWQWAGP